MKIAILCIALAKLGGLALAAEIGYSSKGTNVSYPSTIAGISLLNATALELSQALDQGSVTSVELVEAYLERIAALDHQGLELHSIIQSAPLANVKAIAKTLDDERASGKLRSSLHGIPIIVKDNFDTAEELGMDTSAGSYSLLLEGGVVTDDAFVIKQLRNAGAIILAKANLMVFAGGSGIVNSSAWSPVGGQCSSPYIEGGFEAGGDPGGSSSGSGASVSAGFAPISLGTDTEGSIVGPAERGALYGLRPSTGITSRSGVVPISSSQDTTGPLAKSVWDIAATFEIMAAHDPTDAYSFGAIPFRHTNYTQFLDPQGFQGLRIGIPRYPFYNASFLNEQRAVAIPAIEATFGRLEELGATIVETPFPNEDDWDYTFVGGPRRVNNGSVRIQHDTKADMAFYLQNSRVNSSMLDLQDLITTAERYAELEMPAPHCCQETFVAADQTPDRSTSAEYWLAKYKLQELWENGPAAVFKLYDIDVLLVPTGNMASRIGAVGRAPVGTVPLGYDSIGLPFGMAFVGDTYGEPTVFRAMSAFEANFPSRIPPSTLE